MLQVIIITVVTRIMAAGMPVRTAIAEVAGVTIVQKAAGTTVDVGIMTRLALVASVQSQLSNNSF